MAWFGWRDVETCGVIVAGRSYDFSDFKRAEVITLAETIDAIAQRAGVDLVTVPADIDLSDDTASDDDPAYCSGFIGLLAAEGGTYEPDAVSRASLLAALDKARAIPTSVWDEITAAYRAAGGKQPPSDDIALRLGCTGGLPMAYFAFGMLGDREASLGGEIVRGQAPDQTPHETVVHGISIESCSYDGSSAEPLDLSDAAHAARVAAHPEGGYYLIARYD